MPRLSTPALIRIIFVLVGLIVGVIDFFVTAPALDSVFKAIAFTGLLFIAELALEIRDAQRRETASYDEFVARHRNVTGDLLKHVHAQLSRVLKINDSSFRVRHSLLSVASHDAFWKLLVERVARGGLTVHAVHSCAMNVWLDNDGLMERQKEFCRKGKVIRILCGLTQEPDTVTRKVAKLMTAINIELRYYWLKSPKIVNHDFSWDFAMVEQTGDAAIWRASGPGQEISEAEYVTGANYDDQDLRELWRELVDASDPFVEDWIPTTVESDSRIPAA